MLRRALAIALLAGWIPTASAAAPTIGLVWSGTTGSGLTGSSLIAATVGETLTIDVVLTIDSAGFTAAAWDLVGLGDFTAISNTLTAGAGGPPECPAPPNLAPGTCFSSTFKSFTPLSVGVVDAGSSSLGYDVAGLTPELAPGTMTIGRGVFVVGSFGYEIATSFAPGIGGVTDGAFAFSVPGIASAVIAPEPVTGALLAFGLVALGLAGRRA